MSAEGPPPGADERDIFPTLTASQIARIAPLGSERSFEAGEILFEPGGTNRPLMVVLAGEIEILSDREALVTVHRPGNFPATSISSPAIRRSFVRGLASRAASSRFPRSACAISS